MEIGGSGASTSQCRRTRRRSNSAREIARQAPETKAGSAATGAASIASPAPPAQAMPVKWTTQHPTYQQHEKVVPYTVYHRKIETYERKHDERSTVLDRVESLRK